VPAGAADLALLRPQNVDHLRAALAHRILGTGAVSMDHTYDGCFLRPILNFTPRVKL
jgi:hypothetical protein